MSEFTGKQAAQSAFQISDVVTLKSGGPKMTVMGVDPQTEVGPAVSVIWFVGDEPKTMAGPESCFVLDNRPATLKYRLPTGDGTPNEEPPIAGEDWHDEEPPIE